MNNTNKLKVNSHNEWDPLEEIIIGIADNIKFPLTDPGLNLTNKNIPRQLPQFIIKETKQDLELFAQSLKKLGIIVRRPKPIDTGKKIQTPDWSCRQFFNYCPRDIMTVIGHTIIESANMERSRFLETFAYKDILIDYLKSGCRWVAAPKPQLKDKDYNFKSQAANTLNNFEPIFDAANILRAGRDIFYLVSSSGNELGLKWLQSFLGPEYRVHACRNMYAGVHIDSTIALIRPGLLLANPARVNSKNLPAPLKKWRIIYAPKMQGYIYKRSMVLSSSWLGMNILMINPKLAVVNQEQKELIKILKENKVDVLPLRLRHGRTLAGGFHCITLDICRKGKLKNYFS
jgi:glycine amidinotransferase/scyllo-inosamine-4-phosphate amidinotransferase 1